MSRRMIFTTSFQSYFLLQIQRHVPCVLDWKHWASHFTVFMEFARKPMKILTLRFLNFAKFKNCFTRRLWIFEILRGSSSGNAGIHVRTKASIGLFDDPAPVSHCSPISPIEPIERLWIKCVSNVYERVNSVPITGQKLISFEMSRQEITKIRLSLTNCACLRPKVEKFLENYWSLLLLVSCITTEMMKIHFFRSVILFTPACAHA